MNEYLFLAQVIIISATNLIALRFGKEALITLLCLQALLANIFVTKQTLLFGLCVTCTDAFIIGCDLSLNLLQEYSGRKVAKKAIWISFASMLFYLVISQIHLLYLPAPIDTMHGYFQMICGFAPRIVVASLAAYLTAIKVEYYLYQRLMTLFDGKHVILRNYLSIAVSQLVDTILFSVLGLYGLVDNIAHIMILSYIIKLSTIFLATPLVFWGLRLTGFNRIRMEKSL